VFCDNTVLHARDYTSVAVAGSAEGWRGSRRKGHTRRSSRRIAAALRSGGPWPISLDVSLRAMRIAFAVEDRSAEVRRAA